MCARIVENNNSLELFIFFYRNTLVFLFIKRKVSEEMPFSSEVFRIYWHNFRKNSNNFRSYVYFFGSYCYKWGRNFGSKMLKKGLFQGVKNTLIFRVFAIKNQKGNLCP